MIEREKILRITYAEKEKTKQKWKNVRLPNVKMRGKASSRSLKIKNFRN